eukprot:CAMPEP_0198734668 /NCGR_PEP_ID=MMETSP1475-20131203/54368_1 /TAXON_ID= ORGANISM="Unidentified sp., Strain CCMP1999" /NCGR_SAMPLE_ID=MMETSP1475 /ASSEMBLY_ACC=CAM_ASM_001111 /LENGTH=252 /DNA_ID=CAMNT_0044498183 /DNA_START=65 /DNA_END=823 /DNA_ORIENTATION=+
MSSASGGESEDPNDGMCYFGRDSTTSSQLSESQKTLHSAYTADRITAEDLFPVSEETELLSRRNGNRFAFWMAENLYEYDEATLDEDLAAARQSALQMSDVVFELERTLLIILLLSCVVRPLYISFRFASWQRGLAQVADLEILDVFIIFFLLGLLEEPLRRSMDLVDFQEDAHEGQERSCPSFARPTAGILASVTSLFQLLEKYFKLRLVCSLSRLVISIGLVSLGITDLRSHLPSWLPDFLSDALSALFE